MAGDNPWGSFDSAPMTFVRRYSSWRSSQDDSGMGHGGTTSKTLLATKFPMESI